MRYERKYWGVKAVVYDQPVVNQSLLAGLILRRWSSSVRLQGKRRTLVVNLSLGQPDDIYGELLTQRWGKKGSARRSRMLTRYHVSPTAPRRQQRWSHVGRI